MTEICNLSNQKVNSRQRSRDIGMGTKTKNLEPVFVT